MSETEPEEAISRLLATDPASHVIAEHSGAVVGAVIAAWDGWR